MTLCGKQRITKPPPISIISGASGEQLVQTVLAQFPDHNAPEITVGNVRQVTQIKRADASP